MVSLLVVLRGLIIERRYLRFYDDAFLSVGVFGVQEGGSLRMATQPIRRV